MRVSIVIPAFNEERLIGETLRQVGLASTALTRVGWSAEVIVCDNNSTDRTAEVARAAGARVVFEPINQIARARNTGAATATGDWLIFVDADSHPSPELFADAVEQIQGGRCLAGGSTVRLDSDSLLAQSGARLWNGLSRWRRLLAGSFIFVETATFRKLGGFSQELFVAEELELSRRLHSLARAEGREVVILHRHPLLTSARKLHLYRRREHLRFLFRAAFNLKETLGSREACGPWYDGRR
jgi:glycosyltransferase involved in cell wall biosynthesis